MRKNVAEPLGVIVHFGLIALIMFVASLCPEFRQFPYLGDCPLCAGSLVFFFFALGFNLPYIMLPGGGSVYRGIV